MSLPKLYPSFVIAVFALAGIQSGVAQEPSQERQRSQPDEEGFRLLFPEDGEPKGWVVTTWDDLAKPAEEGVEWVVKDGVLRGSKDRGTWLVWERELADFELKYDFKLGPRGNSGCALRAPMKGDPAFDGLELQMADFRYNEAAKPSELTGGLYTGPMAPIESKSTSRRSGIATTSR